MRKGKIEREKYVRKRKELRLWCDEEKEKHRREKENRIKIIRTEKKAWEYIINKYRKRREK